jgi:26S proteasome regulatory subunit N3
MLTIVQLLMGDIPERAVFAAKGMRVQLRPYLELAAAVRKGSVAEFRAVIERSAAVFTADGMLSLVARLRHNVIKVALRKISLSYSRIALTDVAARLGLDSADDCEYVVAKAIHDGVIDAAIDHDAGCVQSRENLDVYATHEPQAAFDRRIKFCLRLHNDALRSMMYAADAHKPRPLQDDEDAKRLAEEIAEKAEDDGDDGGDADF